MRTSRFSTLKNMGNIFSEGAEDAEGEFPPKNIKRFLLIN